jgi:hypothetical protein
VVAPRAEAVVADYCAAHLGAPSCRSDTAPVSGFPAPKPDTNPTPDFQSGSPGAASAIVGYCAAHPYAASCQADNALGSSLKPAWCADISTMVFATPEEAAQARVACGLNLLRGLTPALSPSRLPSRDFRAQVPVAGPQTHHGRN